MSCEQLEGPVQTDVDPRNLIGRKAFDRNGAKIGTVDEVYLDDATGVPEWAAIRTGLFSRDAFVPWSRASWWRAPCASPSNAP